MQVFGDSRCLRCIPACIAHRDLPGDPADRSRYICLLRAEQWHSDHRGWGCRAQLCQAREEEGGSTPPGRRQHSPAGRSRVGSDSSPHTERSGHRCQCRDRNSDSPDMLELEDSLSRRNTQLYILCTGLQTVLEDRSTRSRLRPGGGWPHDHRGWDHKDLQ